VSEVSRKADPPGWEARLYGRQGCLPLRGRLAGRLGGSGFLWKVVSSYDQLLL